MQIFMIYEYYDQDTILGYVTSEEEAKRYCDKKYAEVVEYYSKIKQEPNGDVYIPENYYRYELLEHLS